MLVISARLYFERCPSLWRGTVILQGTVVLRIVTAPHAASLRGKCHLEITSAAVAWPPKPTRTVTPISMAVCAIQYHICFIPIYSSSFLILSIAVAKVIRYEYLCILCRLTLFVMSGFQSCTFNTEYHFEPSTALGSTFSSKTHGI